MSFKLIGSLLIIVAGIVFGAVLIIIHKREVRSLQNLINTLQYMESELGYRLTPLPELCEKSASIGSGYIKKFFEYLSQVLNEQVQPDVDTCVGIALSRIPEMPQICTAFINDLGKTMGCFGIQGQLDGLRSIRVACEDKLISITKDQEIKLRSYQTLGICAAAALTIILF